jgi:hypothetical protein
MTRTARNSRRLPKAKSQNDYHGCLVPPAEMFDRVLPGRLVIDADLPFEERVDRALRHIETTRFTEDEHERLWELIVEMITSGNR